MPGCSRVNVDTCTGLIVGNLAPTVFVNNNPIAVKGAAIEAHGKSPHAAATTDGASGNVFANNIAVVRAGDLATCAHPATGSGNVSAN